MKFFKIFLVLLLPVTLFTGCLQVDTTVKLNKDGSGTIEEKVMMSSMVVQMMNQFMNSMSDSSGGKKEFKLFKEDELRNKASEYGEGVKFVTGKEVSEDGWEGYTAVYSFKDINNLRMDTNPNKKVELDEGKSEVENDYFSFRFKPGNVAELVINRPDVPMKEESETNENNDKSNQNQPLGDKIVKMMDGMRIKISLQLQGNIVSTNASYVDSSEVTLVDLDLSKLLRNKESLEKFKKSPPKSLDEMKEIVKNIQGMKIELQKPVFIKFN
ncbi:MAG TPA: hypothetical protein VKA26_13945 [Ignavibacteriaceae bacterium]|nr:hypothetical protein [Ignavibacteriaceae bacterium]